MSLHQASGRWKLGLLLALVTAACWATLPVALKITLEQVDPYTLTWFRFVLATGYAEGAGGFERMGAAAVLRKPYGMTEIERLLVAG